MIDEVPKEKRPLSHDELWGKSEKVPDKIASAPIPDDLRQFAIMLLEEKANGNSSIDIDIAYAVNLVKRISFLEAEKKAAPDRDDTFNEGWNAAMDHVWWHNCTCDCSGTCNWCKAKADRDSRKPTVAKQGEPS